MTATLGNIARVSAALVLMLVLVSTLWWARQQPAQQTQPVTATEPGGAPQRLLEHQVLGLRAVTTTETGAPGQTLEAAALRRHVGEAATELEQVDLRLHPPGRPVWRIRAERAWVSADGELILLKGAVTLKQISDDYRPMTLQTREVRVQPKEYFAETDEPVTVNSLDDHLQAVGMQAWFKEPGRIKFLKQVRGHHVVE